MDRDKIIKKLDKLKAEHPEQKIIVETSNGSVELKIGDALIYESMRGEIVIDSAQVIFFAVYRLSISSRRFKQND